ncbi:hypothetical protein L3V16_08285 [Brucella ciceri]|uniref:hypothetical protein n=1 Tax=Brucella TaxID=234 RepID=UPI001F144871|nr:MULTISPECIES: hypothetical protein [Brucella]MCH6203840.1 hypothetical protein [Brucella ciceri]
MKFIIISAVALSIAASPAAATEATRKAAVDAAQQMVADVFTYMGVAYICEEALGSAHYYAARTAAENALRIGGKSDADAIIGVDDFDRRIKREHKKKAPAANTQKCLDNLLKSQQDYKVSKARFEKAKEADN